MRTLFRRAVAKRASVVLLALLSLASGQGAGNQTTQGLATLAGVVVNDSGRPLDRALVGIIGDGLPNGRTAISDDEGRFSFGELPAGRFTLAASKVGFLSALFGEDRSGMSTAIRLAAGQQLRDVRLRLTRAASISGVVIDPRGSVDHNMLVTATRPVIKNGLKKDWSSGSAIVDSAGRFHMDGLQAGTYSVHAEFERRSNMVMATLVVGEHRTGVELRLQDTDAAPRGSRIDGAVTGTDGHSVAYITVGLMSNETGDRPGIAGNPTPQFDGSGHFVYPAVPRGRYVCVGQATLRETAHATGPSTTNHLWASADVVVDGAKPASVSLTLQPAATLSGRIVLDGPVAQRPRDLTPIWVVIKPNDLRAEMSSYMGGEVQAATSADGAFSIHGVPPGNYTMGVWTEGDSADGWRLESVIVNNVDVADVPLAVTAGHSLSGIEVRLTNRPRELSGTLLDRRGRLTSSGTVIVFPPDERMWFADARMIRAIRPDTSGEFLLRGLPAGEYLVAAVDSVERDAWFDPVFLRGLRDEAVRTSVGDAGPNRLTLRIR